MIKAFRQHRKHVDRMAAIHAEASQAFREAGQSMQDALQSNPAFDGVRRFKVWVYEGPEVPLGQSVPLEHFVAELEVNQITQTTQAMSGETVLRMDADGVALRSGTMEWARVYDVYGGKVIPMMQFSLGDMEFNIQSGTAFITQGTRISIAWNVSIGGLW